ncbi:transposase [Methanobrevibacter sp. TMH8]|nr:transposase [Methanobrevibacter sp. TMH8]
MEYILYKSKKKTPPIQQSLISAQNQYSAPYNNIKPPHLKKNIDTKTIFFRPHRSKFTTKAAENLNIKLVYLPPYSPDLNPIEFVWKSIKREISPLLINNLEELRENIKINFYNLTKSISFANKWIKKFLKNKNII